jgi:ubiquinone/menaquinone biosynthesis C-methylase UbiE
MKQVRIGVWVASPILALLALLALLRNVRVTTWSRTDRIGNRGRLQEDLEDGEQANSGSRGIASHCGRFRTWRRVVKPLSFLAQRDASGEQEWMDLPGRDPDELAGMFLDLRRVNRWLGGAWMTSRALDHFFGDRDPRERITILDVASGSVDIPRVMSRWAQRRRRNVSIVATDINLEVLQLAKDHGSPDSVQLVAADALRLPFADDALDVAACSFFLHHLDPDDVVAALREMRRVSRDGVLINDLVRSRISYLGAWLFSRIFTRNAISRHDAPLSARRAYTRTELVEMAARAGLEPVACSGFFSYRVVMVTEEAAAALEPERQSLRMVPATTS